MISDSRSFTTLRKKWLKIFLEEENKNSVEVKANRRILEI